MARKQGFSAFRPKLISLAVASCFAASAALANPTGPTVVNGTAAIIQNGNLLQVTNSPNAIINWQSFSIGASEITRFIQQSQASAVLNRVTGSAGVINPSTILGALQSNGRVFLVNPSGILFGAGAQVDVAGLVATSLNISNSDFLAGKLKFTDGVNAGSVVNQGNITTGQGGQVYLVGNAVTNSGIITSPNGEVVLAAGNSVELVNPGTPNLRVEITAPDNEARNLGQIVVDSGRAGIYAGLVNQSGTVRADSVVAEGGKILLKATKSTTLEAGSVTTANGTTGGNVTVQSGDTTLVAGTVEAKGSDGKGGNVAILGNLVGLTGNASVNASGDTGGGTVLVGGDFQGKNPDVQNAFRTYVGSSTNISADAITSGDGGKVIVWSDDATRAYGTITARGGAQYGNGGFVEVSGKNYLDFAANVNTTAPNGMTGTLLLDPFSIDILDTFAVGEPGTSDADLIANFGMFGPPAANSTISRGAIEQIGQTNSVSISTDGQITIQDLFTTDEILVIGGAGQSFTLTSTSSGGIQFLDSNDRIETNGGNIILNAFGTGTLTNIGGLVSNGGAIQLLGVGGVSVGSGATIDAGTGNLTIFTNGVIRLANAAQVTGANAFILPSSFGNGLQINSTSDPVANHIVMTPADLAKISLTDPATGALHLDAGTVGRNIEFNAPVTFDPSKVATLVLRQINSAQITQSSSAPLSVQKLAVDGGEGGNVSLLANNMVGTLAYSNIFNCGGCSQANSFQFKNAQSLTIGSVAGISGVTLDKTLDSGSGAASISVQTTSGNLDVTQPVTAIARDNGSSALPSVSLIAAGGLTTGAAITATVVGTGDHGNSATVTLTAGGSITVGGPIVALGGFGSSDNGGGVGGNATVTLNAGTTAAVNSNIAADGGDGDGTRGGAATITINAGSGITVAGTISATGGFGGNGCCGSPTGGAAGVALSTTVGELVATSSDINASGGVGGTGADRGAALVNISGQGGVNLTSTSVSSLGGASAATTVASSGGNVQLGDGGVSANAGFNTGNTATITVSAPNGSIQQPLGGQLTVGGIAPSIVLQARDGIGTVAAPIAVGQINFSDVTATNTGAIGDIALQFNEFLNINGTANILNSNPTGTYYLQINQSEGSLLSLSVPFMPGNAALLPGQKVHFKAPDTNGEISFVGPSSGSISGAGQVTLEAQQGISLDSSTSISAGNVLLKSDTMDIQGTVTAANNIFVQQFNSGRLIDLGGASSPGSALALDSSELARLTALGLIIGTSNSSGAISFTAPVGPFSAFPNLFGSSITQTVGGPINSPGGLNAFSTGNITLTNAGNNIGSFGGASSGGSVSLLTTGNIGLGVVNAFGTASLTSSGGLVYNIAGPAGLITAPTINLAGATGVGQAGAPIFVSGVTSLSATNSGSGDIVLSYPAGNFTIGTGGWQLSNAGGDYVIGGQTVTLNNGAPSNNSMFVGANDINIDPSGYANNEIVVLTALNNINVNGNLSAGTDLALFADNTVNINGVTASSPGTVSVRASFLKLTAGSTPALLSAGTDLGVIAGEINLQGGTATGAFAEIRGGPGDFDITTLTAVGSLTTSGNVNLKGGSGDGAYARIYGDPDVGSLLFPVSVGGVINMDDGTGTGAYARIESASVNSIYVDFPSLGGGGFFVNGVENTVSSGDSGFFAGGEPAVAGQNFFVTYGVTGGTGGAVVPAELPASVQQTIDQLAAVTNQQSTTLMDGNVSGEGDSGTGTGSGVTAEEKKKPLPICGK